MAALYGAAPRAAAVVRARCDGFLPAWHHRWRRHVRLARRVPRRHAPSERRTAVWVARRAAAAVAALDAACGPRGERLLQRGCASARPRHGRAARRRRRGTAARGAHACRTRGARAARRVGAAAPPIPELLALAAPEGRAGRDALEPTGERRAAHRTL
eukprot:scaffold121655_cov36-Phaeocystis_antarctica.AAC.1